jgi:hypothetical protein
MDEHGKRLRENKIAIINDELVVLDEDGEPFGYHVLPSGKVRPDVQRVQKTLFHEKQTLIENCLFGVDINPNSVKICRLRLWIELLKHAYYTEESGFAELETLPNIDINIKQGNSLLSRFPLTEDLTEVFGRQKFSLRTYKTAVKAYKEARTKEAKAELQAFIAEIKRQFRESVTNHDPRRKKLAGLRGQRSLLDNNVDIFGNVVRDAVLVEAEKVKLETAIAQAEAEIADAENNLLYRGSFEWRFEFPEVLDEKGNYVGFDVVIGNPPYIRQEDLGESKTLLRKAFPQTYAGTADLYVFFVEQGLNILRSGGEFIYILPNKWMRAGYGLNLRKWLKTLSLQHIADFGDLPVFEEATTYPSILHVRKAAARTSFRTAQIGSLTFADGLSGYLSESSFAVETESLGDDGWQLTNSGTQQLMQKLRAAGKPLGEYVGGKIYYGIKTGLNEAFVIDEATRARLIAEDPRSAEIIKPFLAGRDIKRYQTPKADKYLIFSRRGINIEDYPAILKYLTQFKDQLIPKPKGFKGEWKGRKEGTYKWYEIQDAVDYYGEFEKPKFIIPAIIKRPEITLDTDKAFSNDKTTIVVSDHKYLLGALNSSVTDFVMQKISSTKQGGYFEYKPVYIYQIPIPPFDSLSKETIESLVTQILAAKAADPKADTVALETEIDRLVYALYGLTEDEIAVVEGRT